MELNYCFKAYMIFCHTNNTKLCFGDYQFNFFAIEEQALVVYNQELHTGY